jgi:hypothetical protein
MSYRTAILDTVRNMVSSYQVASPQRPRPEVINRLRWLSPVGTLYDLNAHCSTCQVRVPLTCYCSTAMCVCLRNARALNAVLSCALGTREP